MVNCICKICKNGLREVAENLSQSLPIERVLKSLKEDYDLDCNSYSLKRHLDLFGIPYSSISDSLPTIALEPLDEGVGNYHQPVSLDSLSLSRWGLSTDSPTDIVSFLQEKLLVLSLNQIEIVAAQQQAYLEGETYIEPSKDSIGNLQKLLSLADKFTSISLHANQQKAVQIYQAYAEQLSETSEQLALEDTKPELNQKSENP
ncbi:MAG: hypothetical protein KME15_27695 [Drouetiella hepatica Uher 2000/2452]|jgi:hypothetical protein|uniref:Uncharacterized protein n=1 Tax=Drouetiella hepatica Uher 2000/2452 TaxID=904376 RepID=A0A951QJM3_9CYAN|nr:hypothetical protein [Drouetiella hepatica Uher 2000/2452]